MAAGEHAERGAGVAPVGGVKKSVKKGNRAMECHRPVDDDLGELIQNDNRNQPSYDELPLGTQADAPALSTAAQRAQRVGCDASAPTLVSYFQQRSHFAPSAFVTAIRQPRSEERRVGKECRSRWSPY